MQLVRLSAKGLCALPPASDAASEKINLFRHRSGELLKSARALRELPNWLSEDLEAGDTAVCESAQRTLELMRIHAAKVEEIVVQLIKGDQTATGSLTHGETDLLTDLHVTREAAE